MGNLQNHLNIKRFILISFITLTAVLFYSCTPIKMHEQNIEILSQSAAGGDVYGGKQYVLPAPLTAPCADGRAIKSILIQNVTGVYTLVRDKCEFLENAEVVPRSEVISSSETTVEFRGEMYSERYAESNLPLFYVNGITTKWCRGKLSSGDAVGSTALIEFAEQGDGQFKGQIAWLDYHEGRYDYYNAFEMKLFYNSEEVEPILGISGTDLESDITTKVRIGLGNDYSVTLTKGSSSATFALSCTGF